MKEEKAGGCCVIVILGLVLLSCGGCGIVSIATGGLSYSEGYREGRVQKFSHKGVVWKTYEGELTMDRVVKTENGLAADVFLFSVEDPAVVEQLNKLHQDDEVKLTYKQYLFTPPWRCDTSYLITKVEVIKKNNTSSEK